MPRIYLLLVTLFLMSCFNVNPIVSGGGTTNNDSILNRKRVFTTSGLYRPFIDFSSLVAADAICQSVASGASLGGTWKAWLSSSTISAASRIANVSPWYKLDRTTIVFSGYPNGLLFNQVPLNTDENGNTIVNNNVWSHTNNGGGIAAPPSYDCATWASSGGYGNVGNASLFGSSLWTEGGNLFCNNATGAHFYCFEQ